MTTADSLFNDALAAMWAEKTPAERERRSAFEQLQKETGYSVRDKARWHPWFTVTYNGDHIGVAASMRGARKIIRKHRKGRDEPAWWQLPVIYRED